VAIFAWVVVKKTLREAAVVSGLLAMASKLGPGVVNGDPAPTPLPAALPLFATGVGVMGWLAKRRKRKNAAALAAA